MIREFREFINRGNFVELAVGFVLGVAVTSVVNTIVERLVIPLIAFVLFLIVKAYNRVQRSDPEQPEPEADPDDVVLLREIRDALVTRGERGGPVTPT